MSETLLENEDQHAKRPPGAAAIDIDLYCLECGYNLRGLSGDPIRCPECAYHNPVGDIVVPADQISKQLRQMETAPATSVLGLLCFVPLLGALLLVLYGGAGPWYVRVNACLGAAALIVGTVWVVGIARFRSSCLGRPGWLAVLARYQFVALASAIVIGGAFGIVLQLAAMSIGPLHTLRGLAIVCPALLLTFGGILAAIYWGLRPVHRWLKAPMEQLQRGVAVKMARDRVRRELRQGRRWRRPG